MDRVYSLALGKLIIAVAWADGKLHKSEITALKDELSSLPKISHEDWTILKLYMEYPLSPGEIQYTLIDFKDKYKDDGEEKKIALEALKRIIYADGEVDQKEVKLYKQIVEFLESSDNKAISKLASVFKGTRVPFINNPEPTSRGINRERHLEDFMNNPIFFRFYRAIQDMPEASNELTKEQLRKYCLAGGLLAKIANCDDDLDESELKTMTDCLSKSMGMDHTAARNIIDHAINTDVSLLNTQRVCKQFNEMTNQEEREEFLEFLAKVVLADGKVLAREVMIFREIGNNLHISKLLVREHIDKLKELIVPEVD